MTHLPARGRDTARTTFRGEWNAWVGMCVGGACGDGGTAVELPSSRSEFGLLTAPASNTAVLTTTDPDLLHNRPTAGAVAVGTL